MYNIDVQITSNNILINYRVFGHRNKPSMLVLHGWGRSSAEWVPFAKNFSDSHYVIVPDLPGFGNSSFFDKKEGATLQDYTETIEIFINKLCLKDITLLGHSFGGKVAINLSDKRNLVKKLFLIAPSGVEEIGLKASIYINIAKLLKKQKEKIPSFIYNRLFNLMASKDYKNSKKLKKTFKNIVNEKIHNKAKKIQVPTIIIWGEEDKVLPVKYSSTVKKNIKNSLVRIIWGAGHSPHIEDLRQFSKTVKEYL